MINATKLLTSEALDVLFREARTYTAFLDKPVKVTPAWVNCCTNAVSTRVVEKPGVLESAGSLYFPVIVVGPTTISASFFCSSND